MWDHFHYESVYKIGEWPVAAASQAMRDCLTALYAWLLEEKKHHIVIVGPSGTGKTTLYKALSSSIDDNQKALFPDYRLDYTESKQRMNQSKGLCVFIDDIQNFDRSFRQELAPSINKQQHSLFVTTTQDDDLGWLKALKGAKCVQIKLADTTVRMDDIFPILIAWAIERDLFESEELQIAALEPIAKGIQVIPVEHGFHDVITIAERLHAARSDFSQIALEDIVRAYSKMIRDKKAQAFILVEGIADKIYFEWAARVAESAGGQSLLDGIEVQCCGSASSIKNRAMLLSQKGHKLLALFDYDDNGRKACEEMQKWHYSALTLSIELDPLGSRFKEYPGEIVEIEDLLDLDILRRYYSDHTDRKPELIIDAPREGLTRIVVHKDDKTHLARWIDEQFDDKSATKFIELLHAMRNMLIAKELTETLA